MVRRVDAWETHYSYHSIPALIEIFNANGLILQDVEYWSFTEGYLWRYPLVNAAGRLYDRIMSACQIRQLMGHVCVTFRKPS